VAVLLVTRMELQELLGLGDENGFAKDILSGGVIVLFGMLAGTLRLLGVRYYRD